MNVVLNKAQYDYLKNNNILEQYKKNMKNYCSDDVDFSAERSFIDYFTWDETEEGFDFWKKYYTSSYNLRNNDLFTLEL